MVTSCLASPADQCGWAACDYGAAMCRCIPEAGGWQLADQYGGRPPSDDIGRPRAGGHVGGAGGGQPADEHRRAARRQDGPADVPPWRDLRRGEGERRNPMGMPAARVSDMHACPMATGPV